MATSGVRGQLDQAGGEFRGFVIAEWGERASQVEVDRGAHSGFDAIQTTAAQAETRLS